MLTEGLTLGNLLRHMTLDRLIHLLVGFAFLFVFMRLKRTRIDKRCVFLVASMALGTWAPDWDLLLGIGFHRSPLTHSVIPAVFFALIVFKCNGPVSLTVGFLIGLSAHLFWDIVDYGNVLWIDGGNNDRLFLLANAVLSLLVAAMLKDPKARVRSR